MNVQTLIQTEKVHNLTIEPKKQKIKLITILETRQCNTAGSEAVEYNNNLQKQNHRKPNTNGRRLTDICKQVNLKIMSLMKAPKKQITWRSPVHHVYTVSNIVF